MCSLFIKGQNIYFNRDESKLRCQEKPPGFHWGENIFGPLDPDSGGTWFGVNITGDWAALLNNYQDTHIGSKSRGDVVIRLLEGESIDSIVKDDYSSFYVCHNSSLFSVSNSQLSTIELTEIDNISFLTSSSVRLDEAIAHRTQQAKLWKQGFPGFYLQAGEDPELDVLVDRKKSRSTSVINYNKTLNVIDYFPLKADRSLGEKQSYNLSGLFQ